MLLDPGSSPIPYLNDTVTPATLQMKDFNFSSLIPGTTFAFDSSVLPVEFLVSANLYIDKDWKTTHASTNGIIDCPLLPYQPGFMTSHCY